MTCLVKDPYDQIRDSVAAIAAARRLLDDSTPYPSSPKGPQVRGGPWRPSSPPRRREDGDPGGRG